MSEIILKVKNLNVELGGEEIIKNLSFEVKKGEIFTVLGPNGAGKTVLLKTILGFLPYQGEIIWQKKIRIGYLPQGLSPLKVRDLPVSVREFFKLKGILEEKTLEFLKLVGIKNNLFLKKRIGDLSSGQFQRMLIAWALVSKPDVLLFDEPMAGIDVSGEKTIYSLLHQFRKDKNLTIFLITHDLNVVYKYSDNVLCLRKKGFRCSGPPQRVLSPRVLENLYGTEIKFYKHIR